MKPSQIRELGDADLVQHLDDARRELFNLRFSHVTGQLDNSTALKETRREVARLMTELRSREIAAAEALEESNG
ncbi:MAG TPA: 50S ribosomal protein L29 [Acidimicrobiales bacterium]|nr:50S ribosomal protein L29 [Acidimicrobiales bacterium]